MKFIIMPFFIFVVSIAQAAPITIDFNKGLQNCSVGFADYPVDPSQQGIYELQSSIAALPDSPKINGLMISGTNRSDDLFMYAKCYVKAGLAPGSKHSISFEITSSVDAPAGCSGVGGAPDSLTLKAGASAVEPKSIANGQDEFAMFSLNLDKGNQTVGGQDLAVIATPFNNGMNCDDEGAFDFKTVTKSSSAPSAFTADSNGGFWIVWGTDSAFESTSMIYYQKVNFKIQ